MNIKEIERNGGGRTDPNKIENRTERKFFILIYRLLSQKMPGATIVHEPTLFEITSEADTVGTLPDFLVTRPDGRRIYVEITTSPSRKKESPLKRRQKNVMKISAPYDKYKVVARESLENIQKRYPEVNFFP